MKKYKAEVIIKDKHLLAEAPFYDKRNGMLSYVDIPKGIFYRLDERELTSLEDKHALNVKSFDLGQMIGAAVPMTKVGAYLLAATDGLYVIDGEESRKLLDTSSIYKSFQRSNDAKSDPKGRLFFGSSVYTENDPPSGNLFRLDKGNVQIMEKDTKISNGMAWSKDYKKFYFSDSPYNAVFEYDYDINTGNISNKRVLAEFTDGVPDGLCIDSQDNLWVAVWGGRRVEHRSGKTGELLGIIEVDSENVTSCCFYGEALDKLFITTSGDGQSGENDGCIFSCKVDVIGMSADYLEV